MGNNLAKATKSGGSRVQTVTTENFSNSWNTITEKYVVIHTHGLPGGLYGSELSVDTTVLNALEKRPNIQCVIITACETGGINKDGKNVGQILSTKIATDGYVVCSTTKVSGASTSFTATDNGVWNIYQNGNLIHKMPDDKITMDSVILFLYP